MKTMKQSFKSMIFLIGILLMCSSTFASHFRHGTISWRVVSGNTIEFKISQAWANFGNWSVGQTGYGDRLYFGDGQSQNFSVVITAVNAADNWYYGETTITHTYANAGNFIAYFASCCKISNLVNNSDAYWRSETIVNVGSGNESPVTTMAPIINMQTGVAAATFQVPATDPDGDNLTYRLATPSEVAGTGFRLNRYDGQPQGFSINSTTGVITFNTIGKAVGSLWNASIVVEDGQTKVINDFIIKIVQQSNPPIYDYTVTPANGFIYQVSPGTPINFSVKADDSDPGATVSLQAIGLPVGASFPLTGNNTASVTGNVSWTPSATDLGTNVINFIAQDNVGAQVNTSVSIIVSLKPQFDVPPTPASGVHNVYDPGDVISYTVQASDPDPLDVVQIVAVEGKNMMGNAIPLYTNASFSPLPTASGNPTSGTFTWTTQASDWGHRHVYFTAQDSYGDQTVHEVAQLINTPPTFASSPITSADVGVLYSYTIQVTDADIAFGDAITIMGNTVPSWLSLVDNGNGTATLSGTPTVADVGANPITIGAEDINHHQDPRGIIAQSFTITVNNCTVNAVTQNITVNLDANGNASITAADIDNGSTATCGIASLAIDNSTFNCNDVGSAAACDNTGLTFDGINDLLSIGNVSELSFDYNTPFTIEGWTNASNSATSQVIVSKMSGSNRGYVLYTYNAGSNTRGIRVQLNNTYGSNANFLDVFTTTGVMSIGSWNHIAMTYDGSGNVSGIKLYLNGNLLTTNYHTNSTTLTTSITNSTAVTIGSQPSLGSVYSDSDLDDIRFWNTARTASEISANMNNCLSGSEANLVGYYPMSDGSGTVVSDLSSSANNGTMFNFNSNTAWVAGAPLNSGTTASGSNVTLTVTDNNGNTATSTATVTVIDNTSPNAVCQDITIQLDASGNASITAADVDGGSSDACGIASLTIDNGSFSCANVGSNTVTLTVIDNNGNVSTCTATVTVEDNVAPVASATGITIQLDANGNAGITPADIDNGSNDACGIASLAVAPSSFDCSNTGANTVTLTVTDNNGNVSTTNATVIVEDIIAPTISCPADISIIAQPNDCSPVVSWAAPIADDNCTYTVSSTHNSGDRFDEGTTTVTYTVTDASGNSASCSFNVTISVTPLTLSLSSPTFIGGNNISCNGETDGSIDATSGGGCLPYSYSWSNGSTTEDVSNLGAGNYSVTMTDAKGRTISQSITLTEPTPLVSGSIVATPQFPVGGLNAYTIYLGYGTQTINMTASASGATPAYSYSWAPATGLSNTNTASTDASPTATTTYTVTITDANGCSVTESFTINVIDARCGKKLNKVLVCHKESKTKRGVTTISYHNICVSANAVPAHLAHGDYLGPCTTSARIKQDPIAHEQNAILYPNPNNGNFNVSFDGKYTENITLTVRSIDGRIISQKVVSAESIDNDVQLNIERNAKGLYFLQIQSGNFVKVIKFNRM